jgi:hypothetical protein
MKKLRLLYAPRHDDDHPELFRFGLARTGLLASAAAVGMVSRWILPSLSPEVGVNAKIRELLEKQQSLCFHRLYYFFS